MKFKCPVQRKIENSKMSQIVLGHQQKRSLSNDTFKCI